MTTGSTWTAARVLGLAPNGASSQAGQGLASPRKWGNLGRTGDLLWGECQGSGSKPYQCRVDAGEPATSCSCPSRKFPCKHALGLMLIWADDPAALPTAEAPDWVASWVEQRAKWAGAKQEKAEQRAAEAAPKPIDVAGKGRRKDARVAKVAAGLDDLDLWVRDLVRSGFAALAARTGRIWDEQARRLIDAQCPGVARRVRQIDPMSRAGDGWQAALLDRLAQLHLMVEGFRRREGLPEGVRADLRAAIGFPVDLDAVRSGAIGTHIHDTWRVLGQTFAAEDKVTMRRVSLWGRDSRRAAQVIDFAAPGRTFEIGPEPGTSLDATLGFFPGSAPLRALVIERHAPPEAIGALDGGRTIAEAQADLGALLARSPWVEQVPVVLAGITLRPGDEGWRAVDPTGAFVPIARPFDRGWDVLATSGGAPITLAAEFDGASLHPIGAAMDGSYLPLAGPDEAMHAPPVGGSPGRWLVPETRLMSEAAASAVLGADRKGPPPVGPDHLLAPVAPGLATREPPARLLALAAAAGLAARAGRRPATGPIPPPDRAPDDDRPACSASSAAHLGRLLAGEFGPPTDQASMCWEWFVACDRAQQRLPHGLLAATLAAFEPLTLIPTFTAVLGTRGRWLARRNPKWHRVAGPGPAEDAATVWETGTKAERLALLRALRRSDPDEARRLVESTFGTEPAALRAEIIQAVKSGLTMRDEPFLETALDDRSKEVRAAAATLLADLPESRLVERMTARARAILQWDGDNLAVHPPEKADAALVRDGIAPEPQSIGRVGQPLGNVGRQGWLLIEILSRVPPARIAEHLGRPVPALINAALATDHSREILLSWETAAIRFRDNEWCLRLIEVGSLALNQRGTPNLAALAGALDPSSRDALILAHLPNGAESTNPQSAIFTLLDAIEGGIGPESGREVARWIGDEIVAALHELRAATDDESFRLVSRSPRLDSRLTGRWQSLIPRLPVEMADDLTARLRNEMARPTVHPFAPTLIARLNQALDRWTFRRDLHQEFAPR